MINLCFNLFVCKNIHHGGGAGRDYFRLSSQGSLFWRADIRAEVWGGEPCLGKKLSRQEKSKYKETKTGGWIRCWPVYLQLNKGGPDVGLQIGRGQIQQSLLGSDEHFVFYPESDVMLLEHDLQGTGTIIINQRQRTAPPLLLILGKACSMQDVVLACSMH